MIIVAIIKIAAIILLFFITMNIFLLLMLSQGSYNKTTNFVVFSLITYPCYNKVMLKKMRLVQIILPLLCGDLIKTPTC